MAGTNEEVDVMDRRAAISAAFDQAEQNDEPETVDTPEPQEAKAPAKVPAEPGSDESGEGETTPADPPADDPDAKKLPEEVQDDSTKVPVDKAPQSWRGPQKAKWATLDPEIKQEVMRREREITKALSDSSEARKLSGTLQQMLTPFMPRFQQMKAHPLHAINELLKADQILSTAPKEQRAQYVAKIISDYGVDIEALDAALAGQSKTDPVNDQVQKLVQQQLAPFQEFMSHQQRQAQETAKQAEDRMVGELQDMAADTEKYPHFNDVKSDMADIYEIQAKKGVYLSLDQVYNRAIAMNPEVSGVVAAQKASEAKRLAALAANARAQKAKNAGISPKSAPTSTASGTPSADDRRATIAAAFDAATGR